MVKPALPELTVDATAMNAKEKLDFVRQRAFKIKHIVDKACTRPRKLRNIALAGVSHEAIIAKWASEIRSRQNAPR